MILEFFALYDMKAAVFAAPFVAPNVNVARRLVHQSTSPTTVWGMYPEDFQLYKIGGYDDATGAVVGHPPVAICSLADLLVRAPQPSEEMP